MIPTPPDRRVPQAQLSEEPVRLDLETLYASGRELDLPWFSPTLDEEFDMALEHYSIRPKAGPVLDLGTGPGTAAIELAKRQYEVYALDGTKGAIKMAKRRAGALAKQINWVHSDIFQAAFEVPLQMVYDRGLYHMLDRPLRKRYPVQVGAWIKDRGLLFLKAFSLDEPGDYGPHRISEDEIRENFAPLLDLIKVEHTTFPGTLDHDPKANFFVLRRRVSQRSLA